MRRSHATPLTGVVVVDDAARHHVPGVVVRDAVVEKRFFMLLLPTTGHTTTPAQARHSKDGSERMSKPENTSTAAALRESTAGL